MSHAQVFEWQKRFLHGWRRCVTWAQIWLIQIAKTNENIQKKIQSFVEGDCHLMIRMITEVLNMNKESIFQILIEEPNIWKVCGTTVPWSFNEQSKSKESESSPMFWNDT